MYSSADALSLGTAATILPGNGSSSGIDDVEDRGSSAPIMPLRVIDVEATIMNRQRGGICFTRRQTWHVISHTWSADVREFSEIVGWQLKAAALDQAHQIRSYEQLFEAANFTDSPSYQTFVDFLMVLRADKVRLVWFDAVCINQTDSQEKDNEIQHMGTYYERSLGSYVVHHGIGKGFTMLGMSTQSDHEGMQLPRWFSRAWTLQEWVLPQRTTFIVDLESEENLQRTATTAILRFKNEKCLCCNYETTFNPAFLRKYSIQSAYGFTTGDINLDDLSAASAKVRHLCQYDMGKRQPHFRRIPDRKDWYFTDDLGYVFLVKLKLQLKNAASWPGWAVSTVQQQHALSDSEFQLTERLGVKMWLSGISAYGITRITKVPLVIEEISVRDCSNAEDRVLSVLRLLGVEGAIQVRSGKSLNEQIVHLARGLLEKGEEHNRMLLQLCLADGYGNETQGMSWAPNFEVKKGSWQDSGRQLAERMVKSSYMQTFEARAQVQEVSMTGELQLVSEAVCTGQLICCDHDLRVDKDRSRADELVKPMTLQLGGQVVFYLCARFSTQLAAEACVIESVSNNSLEHGSSCIVLRAPWVHKTLDHLPFREVQIHNPLDYLRERIPVWLVKMGEGRHRDGKARYVTYFLLCIGDSLQSPLHKIGYVGIGSEHIASHSHLAGLRENKKTMCRIGGLGRDSTKHLFKRPGTCHGSDCLDCILRSGYHSE